MVIEEEDLDANCAALSRAGGFLALAQVVVFRLVQDVKRVVGIPYSSCVWFVSRITNTGSFENDVTACG